jgi:type VI secretion system secreted protein VgrG
LPANAAVTTLKSNSTKGGGGFNEMRFDDRKGSEQMFFHAERDHETWIVHDTLTNVGRDRHLSVGGAEFKRTAGDRNDTVTGSSASRVDGSATHATLTDHSQYAGAAYSLTAGMSAQMSAGMTLVLEAGTSIALRAGTQYLLIGPETIEVSSMPIPLAPGPPVVPVNVPPPAPQAPRDADDGSKDVAAAA